MNSYNNHITVIPSGNVGIYRCIGDQRKGQSRDKERMSLDDLKE